MPTKKIYQQLAREITRHDWDEQPQLIIRDTNYEYEIKQFQGTAFDSDYQCYKISGKEWIPQGVKVRGKQVYVQFVAKISNVAEVKMLQMLYEQQYPVPFVAYALGSPKDPQSAMMFESFIPGKELFQIDSIDAWKKASVTIANIHSHYWNTSGSQSQWWADLDVYREAPTSNFNRKIACAETNAVFWKETMQIVKERLKTAPKTLVHGDLFPTNVLINDNKCVIIDWAYAGAFPYFLDLGRFTGIVRLDTERMCKYETEVCNAYFEKMESVLNLSYEEFMRDVYLGQFIECANYYQPPYPIFGSNNSKYNSAVKNRLDVLSKLIAK